MTVRVERTTKKTVQINTDVDQLYFMVLKRRYYQLGTMVRDKKWERKPPTDPKDLKLYKEWLRLPQEMRSAHTAWKIQQRKMIKAYPVKSP